VTVNVVEPTVPLREPVPPVPLLPELLPELPPELLPEELLPEELLPELPPELDDPPWPELEGLPELQAARRDARSGPRTMVRTMA
jgi:hypothetical protein